MNSRECTKCKTRFNSPLQEVRRFEERDIPLPEACSRCNFRHMLAFWVFGRFRRGVSDLSGKSFITNLPNKTRFPIYTRDEWISDAWDALEFGKEYDLQRPFFDQFRELQEAVPHPHQYAFNNVNCDWCDDTFFCKDCYLCRSMLNSEYLSYSYRAFRCKNSIDLVFTFDSELCYGLTYCFNCYKTYYSLDSRACMNSFFLYDCRNCTNCFMCTNLRNKQYCFFNTQFTKLEYEEKVRKFDLGSNKTYTELERQFSDLLPETAYHRADYNSRAEASSGNYLEGCRACENCYFLQNSENCTNTLRGLDCKDTSYSIGTIAEKAIYTCVDGFMFDTLSTTHNNNCRYSEYLDFCDECEYCFACVGLRKKKYCIFNRQYQQNEFQKIRDQIIIAMKIEGSWGKFFPLSLAPCGYNNSIAQAYFEEDKELIISLGGFFDEENEKDAEGLHEPDIPDNIKDIPDSFCAQALVCPETRRRFNIAPREMQFLKEHFLSIPRHHPDYRILRRFSKLTNTLSCEDACARCRKEIIHYYPPEWGYKKIFCMECYQNEV